MKQERNKGALRLGEPGPLFQTLHWKRPQSSPSVVVPLLKSPRPNLRVCVEFSPNLS